MENCKPRDPLRWKEPDYQIGAIVICKASKRIGLVIDIDDPGGYAQVQVMIDGVKGWYPDTGFIEYERGKLWFEMEYDEE